MQTPPFKLERYFARYEFAVPYLLSSSDCEALTVAEVLALEPGAAEELLGLKLGYTESQGDPRLRQSIAGIYEGVGPEEVLVHAGAEEAIFNFMHVALEAGDHLIVHQPGYQSTFSLAQANGVEVTFWKGREEEGWSLDPDELAAAITPRTKAVVLNCPNNPTGYLMDRERFQATVEIARKHGIYLFSDEVYRELEHYPKDRLPAACDAYEKGVSLGVLSKSYGLPGLRIGWVATRDRDLFQGMAAFKDYLTICNSAPSERLARVALDHREGLTERNRGIVVVNLDLADAFFERHQQTFRWQRPTAGPIAFPGYLPGGAEAFCQRMAEEAGVLLLPGTLFDPGNLFDRPDAHLRFGFGRRNFPEGLSVLESHLAALARTRG